jgi:hypothetical protein
MAKRMPKGKVAFRAVASGGAVAGAAATGIARHHRRLTTRMCGRSGRTQVLNLRSVSGPPPHLNK